MIDLITTYLSEKITSLGLFKKIIPLVEIIFDEAEKSFPAQYCGKGEYKHVSDFDRNNGLIYFRKNGNVSSDNSDTNSIGSENEIKITVPIKAVFAIRKDTIKALDNSYVDDKMSLNIIATLTSNNIKSLRQSLKVSNVSIVVQNWNTDRVKVWEDEYKNIPMEMPFEYVYASVDFNVVIEGATECFDLYKCN